MNEFKTMLLSKAVQLLQIFNILLGGMRAIDEIFNELGREVEGLVIESVDDILWDVIEILSS